MPRGRFGPIGWPILAMNPSPQAKLEIATLTDADLRGKTVLCRVDFNVPLVRGEVADDTRIRAALPTLRAILAQTPRALILLSHLGRPKGEQRGEFSLAPVARRLGELLTEEDVCFVEDCIGPIAEAAVASAPLGTILLMENTRFHAGETINEPEFATALAQLGEIFINDAFGSAHRAHASNIGVSDHLPSYAGLLFARELLYLHGALREPKRPYLAILGGAKVSDKITLLDALLAKADQLLIGGGMANTFLAAQGQPMGDSWVEESAIPIAKELLQRESGRIVLPKDLVWSAPAGVEPPQRQARINELLPAGWRAMDIGSATVAAFKTAIQHAKTIFWNGPLGVTEQSAFAQGTLAIARALIEQTALGATSIVGGGDSAAILQDTNLAQGITHLSTGGGAALALLAGESLPALEALKVPPR